MAQVDLSPRPCRGERSRLGRERSMTQWRALVARMLTGACDLSPGHAGPLEANDDTATSYLRFVAGSHATSVPDGPGSWGQHSLSERPPPVPTIFPEAPRRQIWTSLTCRMRGGMARAIAQKMSARDTGAMSQSATGDRGAFTSCTIHSGRDIRPLRLTPQARRGHRAERTSEARLCMYRPEFLGISP